MPDPTPATPPAPPAPTPPPASAVTSDTLWRGRLSDLLSDPRAGRPLPERVDRYRITRLIGQGGMGVVYAAHDERLGRDVALKVTAGGAGGGAAGGVSALALQRFVDEAKHLASLDHPGIAQIFDAGAHVELGPGGEVGETVPYYVMEHIPGSMNLVAYAEAHRLGPGDRVRLFIKVCEAVHHGHQRGIVHRDLKPQNILVDDTPGADPQPKVIDFGIAKAMAARDTDTTALGGPDASSTPDPPGVAAPAGRTLPGALVGTLGYLSPEQCRATVADRGEGGSGPVLPDERCDVYALGVVLYELLCGRSPHDLTGLSDAEAVRAVANEEPRVPCFAQGATPRRMRAILHRALARDRDRRYQTAGELAADLRRHLRGPWHVRRPVLAAAALIASVTFLSAATAPPLAGLPVVNKPFERLVSRLTLVPSATDSLSNVRIVMLDDDDERGLTALAQRHGVEGVDPADRPSLRRLHGALLRRLADANSGARVVTFDIMFDVSSSEFDPDLVAGIEALRAKRVPVVLPLYDWNYRGDLPTLSPALNNVARSGSATSLHRYIDFVLLRGRTTRPSLVAATLAACWRLKDHPEWKDKADWDPEADWDLAPDWHLDPEALTVKVLYKRVSGAGSRSGGEVLAEETISIQDARPPEPGALTRGMRQDDIIGEYRFTISDDMLPVIEAATRSYTWALGAPEEELQRWAAGRVIMVADGRANVDLVAHDDLSTRVHGYYLHASAIEQALGSGSSRRVRPAELTWLIMPGAAIIGVGVGMGCARSVWGRWGALLALTGVVAFGSFVAYRSFRYLCTPAIPAVALLLAAEPAAWLARQRLAHRTSISPEAA